MRTICPFCPFCFTYNQFIKKDMAESWGTQNINSMQSL
jgi:hypothetical protein